jgi:hypothetical protein
MLITPGKILAGVTDPTEPSPKICDILPADHGAAIQSSLVII